MGKVIFDISMSLDGFVSGPNVRPEEGMGDEGMRLHEWVMNPEPADKQFLDDPSAHPGAVICGRLTYDISLPWWGADGPTGKARWPLFVVTRRDPGEVPENSVYHFVTDGVRSALDQARAAAGAGNVHVMSANVAGQLVDEGLVDEVLIHLAPVLLGDGIRLYERAGGAVTGLELTDVTRTSNAIHLRHRVSR